MLLHLLATFAAVAFGLGAPTHVSVLKDSHGNPEMVGMTSVVDRSVVAVGEDLDDVTRVYATRLRNSATRPTSLPPASEETSVEGVSVRSGGFASDARTYVMARISASGPDGRMHVVVDVGAGDNHGTVLARPGDKVRSVTVTAAP